jgi:hypothetical protein
MEGFKSYFALKNSYGHAKKKFFEIRWQFGHALSKTFASPVLTSVQLTVEEPNCLMYLAYTAPRLFLNLSQQNTYKYVPVASVWQTSKNPPLQNQPIFCIFDSAVHTSHNIKSGTNHQNIILVQ